LKKSNQKTFGPLRAGPPRAKRSKSFLRAFFQKSASFFLLCLLGGLASLAAGQDASWDLQNYHIYNGYTLLHPARWHDFNFAQSQSFLNPILDVPLCVLDAVFPASPRVVAFCAGIPFGVLAFFTIRLARRLFAGQPYAAWAAGIAVIIGLSGTATVSQIGLSSNEVLVAAFIIAALDTLLARPESLRAAALAGLLAGLATGGKLTAAPYAVGLAAALVAAGAPRRLPGVLAAFALTGLGGLLLTGGFWMVHLQRLYGDPIFPYANQIFKSPWAGPYGYNDTRFLPHSRRQALLYPFLWMRKNDFYVTEKPFADARLAAVFALSLLALAGAGWRRRFWPPAAWRGLMVFWFVSYALWEKLFSIYRYAVPLEVTGGILVLAALRALAPERPASLTAAGALLAVFIGRATIYPNWGHVRFQAQAIPLTLPPIMPGTLVVATDASGVSFIAAAAPPEVTFIGVNNNFHVPDESLTWRRLADTIATWRGPLAIITTASGGQAALASVADIYNLAPAGACRTILSALNRDSLRLCPAHLLPGPAAYQPSFALNFSDTGNAAPYVTQGWREPEGFGRWSVVPEPSLTFPTNAANRQPLKLGVLAYAVPPSRVVDVLANGALIAQWRLAPSPALYQAELPAPGRPRLVLTFLVHDFCADNPLGVGLMGMTIQEKLPEDK